MGGYSPGSLFAGQAKHGIYRSAKLEGPPLLEVLAFEKKRPPGQSVEGRRPQDRRTVNVGTQSLKGFGEGIFIGKSRFIKQRFQA
jgi:hypothetical protein